MTATRFTAWFKQTSVPAMLWGLSLCSCASADLTPEQVSAQSALLVQSQGAAYLQERDALLSGAPADIAAVRAYLGRVGASEEEKSVAAILKTRVERHDAALRYDQIIAECRQNPKSNIIGEPSCSFPPLRPDTWALGFEVAWKRQDLPTGWRLKKIDALVVSAMEPDPLLALLRSEPGWLPSIAIALSGVPSAKNDDRVYAALVSGYQQMRTQDQGILRASDILICLARFGTPRALQTLHQLEQFDRNLMTQRGLAPWQDTGQAQAEFQTAASALGHEEQEKFSNPEGSDQRIAAAKVVLQQKETALYSVWLWRDYDRVYALLAENGIQAGRAPSPP